MGVTILLAAAKLGRLVLSQFVRCEHCRWNARVQNCASSVQFMCREQSSLHFIYPEVQMKRAYLLYNAVQLTAVWEAAAGHEVGSAYDTRCCLYTVRSKLDMSQLNLPHATDN